MKGMTRYQILWSVVSATCAAAVLILILLMIASNVHGQTVRPFSGLHSYVECGTSATRVFQNDTTRRRDIIQNQGLVSIRIGVNDTLVSRTGVRLVTGSAITVIGPEYLGSVWCISETSALVSVGILSGAFELVGTQALTSMAQAVDPLRVTLGTLVVSFAKADNNASPVQTIPLPSPLMSLFSIQHFGTTSGLASSALVSGQGTTRIEIYGLSFVLSSLASIWIQEEGLTGYVRSVFGRATLGSTGGAVIGYNGFPWYRSEAGSSIVIYTAGGNTPLVGGNIVFIQR